MKKQFVKPTIPSGTRDFLPTHMLRRHYVTEVIERVFKKYSYEPLHTPSIEKLSVLTGKYGEEGESLIFKILRRGTQLEKIGRPGGPDAHTVTDFNKVVDFALRYDLTVPLCRVVAMYQNELTFPFKRYQIQPVWRADRPQKGRYREFYQCDVDAVGSGSMLADAEVLAIIDEVLGTLGFEAFRIRLNNRKILTGIVEYAGADESLATPIFITIDKLDKIGIDGVTKELETRGLDTATVKRLLKVLEIEGDNDTVMKEIGGLLSGSAIGTEGVAETAEVLDYARGFDIPEDNLSIDLSLARGLSYYTGPIFETIVEEPNLGSLTGGGRYDKLVGMFLGRDIPATGTSFGIERIIDVMTQLDMLPPARTSTAVLVTLFNEETRTATLELITDLRRAGINSELYFNAKHGIGKQLKYANRKGIPLAVIAGPDEIAEGRVTLKNLTASEQETLDQDALVDRIKGLVAGG